MTEGSERWPELPLAAWQPTRDTLHLWTQIIGKLRLRLAPYVNHWWQVPLYLTSRGLTTSTMPIPGGTLDATFDIIDHRLVFERSDGRKEFMALEPRSVANFYQEVKACLKRLNVDVRFSGLPSELPSPIRFEDDQKHASYDKEYVHRFWRILLEVDEILKDFRGRFIGKASPTHFFWGGFDLAVTRFSGRRAPERPGADSMTREGYSHEVCSAGFWTGSGSLTGPAFYCYAAPEPVGFKDARVRPPKAFYSAEFLNFLLLYDDVRSAPDPRSAVLEFYQSTYDAAADLGQWDRENLDHK